MSYTLENIHVHCLTVFVFLFPLSLSSHSPPLLYVIAQYFSLTSIDLTLTDLDWL